MKANTDNGQGYARSALLVLAMLATFCATGVAVDAPAGWRTYRNRDYGFVISYSKEFKLYANEEASQRSVIPVCDTGTIACLEYGGDEYEGTRLEAAGIAVSIVSKARTEEECNKIDTGQFPIKKEVINGIRFHYGETGSAAAGNVIGGPAYRTFHDRVCFELALRVATDNTPHDSEDEIKQFDSTNLERQLARILHTFRFVDHSIHRAESK